MDVFKTMSKDASRRTPKAVGIDAILCTDPQMIVVIFIKEMLLAGTWWCCISYVVAVLISLTCYRQNS